MRIYLDTGIFIDFLDARGNYTSGLRSTARRGRPLARIAADAEQIFNVVSKHQAATSCLTYYEVEEALYRELSSATKGVSHANKLIIPCSPLAHDPNPDGFKAIWNCRSGIDSSDCSASIADFGVADSRCQGGPMPCMWPLQCILALS